MSLAAAFRNTTKIVTDKVINQSWGAIDDGMWWCYFGDGAMPSKIFVFSYARDRHPTLLHIIVALELWAANGQLRR